MRVFIPVFLFFFSCGFVFVVQVSFGVKKRAFKLLLKREEPQQNKKKSVCSSRLLHSTTYILLHRVETRSLTIEVHLLRRTIVNRTKYCQ